MDLIISHKSCPDGFCAAFIARKRYPNAEMLPLNHGDPLPLEQVRGKDILVLDFSWRTRYDNELVAQTAKSIRILDHHKSAKEIIGDLPYATFDMNRSGAGLTWDYLFGTSGALGSTEWNPADPFRTLKAQPRPWYVNYIEDYDLWNHKFIATKEVNAFLHSLNFDFAEWEELDNINILDAADRGKYIVRNDERYVKLAIKQAFEGRLIIPQGFDPEAFHCDYSVKVVNALYTYASQIGAALVESGADIGITWFERSDDKIQFSLRSLKGGPVDISKIAVLFGGGGHASAAGFTLGIYEGRSLIDSILNRKCGLGITWQKS